MNIQRQNWHLRVSITPLCNFRCVYCNPSMEYDSASTLSDAEIIEIVKAAHKLGIRRVHWTGGEPTLRDVVKLVSEAGNIGYTAQIITTNGSRLLPLLQPLARAGLTRINVSLDTLNPEKNQKITHSTHWKDTYEALLASLNYFSLTKMNVVLLKDTLVEVFDMVQLSHDHDGRIVLKYIELTPNNPAFYESSGVESQFVPIRSLCKLLEDEYGKLKPISDILGDNPNCQYFQVGKTKAVVGYIAMPSTEYHCGNYKCRKLRISPFGNAGICIGTTGINVKGLSPEEITPKLEELMKEREEMDDKNPCRKHYQGIFGYWRFGDLNEKNRR